MSRNSDTEIAIKDIYAALFKSYVNGLNGHAHDLINTFRKEGFQAFEGGSIPTRRDEDWKYTNVALFLEKQYQEGESSDIPAEAIAPFLFDQDQTELYVFVNGKLNQSLSKYNNDAGVEVHPVKEALNNDEFKKSIYELNEIASGTEKNAFAPLNQAFSSDGYFISAGKNKEAQKTIHFLYYNTKGSTPHFSSPQLYIDAAAGSKVTVVQSFHGEVDAEYFSNIQNRVRVGKNAVVNQYKIQKDSKASAQVSNTFIDQHRDSIYSNYLIDLGGGMVRNNLSTTLKDSNTETNYYGVYLGDGKQHIDNQTFIDHAVPHCNSNELYKGILTDSAKGIFNGKVMVRQDAQKTNAFQQNSSLVLSDKAEMDAKPQLEIFADDVKCSHGATIGQLDEASIFYLRSRGIPEKAAKNLLQKAFIGEVIQNFEIESLRELCYQWVDQKLSNTSD